MYHHHHFDIYHARMAIVRHPNILKTGMPKDICISVRQHPDSTASTHNEGASERYDIVDTALESTDTCTEPSLKYPYMDYYWYLPVANI